MTESTPIVAETPEPSIQHSAQTMFRIVQALIDWARTTENEHNHSGLVDSLQGLDFAEKSLQSLNQTLAPDEFSLQFAKLMIFEGEKQSESPIKGLGLCVVSNLGYLVLTLSQKQSEFSEAKWIPNLQSSYCEWMIYDRLLGRECIYREGKCIQLAKIIAIHHLDGLNNFQLDLGTKQIWISANLSNLSINNHQCHARYVGWTLLFNPSQVEEFRKEYPDPESPGDRFILWNDLSFFNSCPQAKNCNTTSTTKTTSETKNESPLNLKETLFIGAVIGVVIAVVFF